jgi:phosphoenolpyruvate mutase
MSLVHSRSPARRRGEFKAALDAGRKLRLIETFSGLSGLIGSTASVGEGDAQRSFDGLWISSFTSSASKGLPDVELTSLDGRLDTIAEIATVTGKPLIVDGDTGGEAVQFEYLCRKLDLLGASAVIIEDKGLPKRNSLSGDSEHRLDDPALFAEKISRGREARLSDDFLVFARLESLIAGLGVDDALRRARIYLAAGADGILIHSRDKTPERVFEFFAAYQKLCDELGARKLLACVPTAYDMVTSVELFKRGADMVIFANHLLRAAVKAMQATCETLLAHDRGHEASVHITPVAELFGLVGFQDAIARDNAFRR